MKFSGKLSYKGRITSTVFVGLTILFIREIVKIYFGQAPHSVPIMALVPLLIAWCLGYQYDKSVYLSTNDTLTGLFNRRYVLDKFSKESKYAIKKDLKMAILILDVNDFKEINDNYGHKYGDQVLEKIAKLLEDAFGQKDIIARWGGDEFLVLSKFQDEQVLMKRIAHFESTIKNIGWQFQHNGLSVSIGKAIFPSDAKTLKDLINQADANMYELKMNHKQKKAKRMG